MNPATLDDFYFFFVIKFTFYLCLYNLCMMYDNYYDNYYDYDYDYEIFIYFLHFILINSLITNL